jgi:hypothetical protein
MTPFQVLEYIFARDLVREFSNICICFRIFIDISVSSCCWRMIILEAQIIAAPSAFLDDPRQIAQSGCHQYKE